MTCKPLYPSVLAVGAGLLASLCLMAAPAQAQSMNVPMIVNQTLTQVCLPWMQTGDREAAVRAAAALGYDVRNRSTGALADPDNPPSRIYADGSARHRGTIILTESRDRVCAVDLAEAGPGQISRIAAPHLTAAGMQSVLDRTGEAVEVVIWAGEGRQAIIAPSVLSSGASITLNWLRPE